MGTAILAQRRAVQASPRLSGALHSPELCSQELCPLELCSPELCPPEFYSPELYSPELCPSRALPSAPRWRSARTDECCPSPEGTLCIRAQAHRNTRAEAHKRTSALCEDTGASCPCPMRASRARTLMQPMRQRSTSTDECSPGTRSAECTSHPREA
eukprot:15478685-Alexandrium_andersonii.AAC.1